MICVEPPLSRCLHHNDRNDNFGFDMMKMTTTVRLMVITMMTIAILITMIITVILMKITIGIDNNKQRECMNALLIYTYGSNVYRK